MPAREETAARGTVLGTGANRQAQFAPTPRPLHLGDHLAGYRGGVSVARVAGDADAVAFH